MAGYQFIHFENYARKCRSEKKNRTVGEVLDEAFRVPGNMPHVGEPTPPRVVFGCSEEELRAAHDAVNDATQTQKNGKTRKIRNTQNTLATAVLSYPVSCEELLQNSAEMEKYAKWLRRSLWFMTKEWGENFKCAVQHVDEKFPHIHCFAIAPDFDASNLHPGLKAANIAAEKGVKGKGLGAAACAGLRRVQDDYQREVGQYCGLARVGPRRRRLSRKDWRDEQHDNDMFAEKIKNRKVFKDEAALDFAHKKIAGKVIAVRSAAKNEDIRKAVRKAVERAVEPYREDLDKAEKNAKRQTLKAVDAERSKRKIEAVNSQMADTVLSLQENANLYEYALSEAITGLHHAAEISQKPAAYRALSGACETVISVNTQKPTMLQNLAEQVRHICRSVKEKTPAMFRKFFGWTSQTEAEKEKTLLDIQRPRLEEKPSARTPSL